MWDFVSLMQNKQIYLSYSKSYQIKAKKQKVYLLVRYANRLICIFININENLRNVRKSQKKIRYEPTKLPTCMYQFLTIVDY